MQTCRNTKIQGRNRKIQVEKEKWKVKKNTVFNLRNQKQSNYS